MNYCLKSYGNIIIFKLNAIVKCLKKLCIKSVKASKKKLAVKSHTYVFIGANSCDCCPFELLLDRSNLC